MQTDHALKTFGGGTVKTCIALKTQFRTVPRKLSFKAILDEIGPMPFYY